MQSTAAPFFYESQSLTYFQRLPTSSKYLLYPIDLYRRTIAKAILHEIFKKRSVFWKYVENSEQIRNFIET